ncbi:MAG: hypothetical protein LBD99_02650 [Candidatus Margulisbacteria bacterium]|jgi:hypothetical protein|nr:hypothetical protein [Candidatus Margulisiibacteriota bacterium]
MLLKLARDGIQKFFEILLWVILVFSAVTGLVGGAGAGGFFGALFGLIIGTLAGLLWVVLFGGVLATFFNIDKNIQKLADKK